MWSDEKQERLQELQDAEARHSLSSSEAGELAGLTQERCEAHDEALQEATRRGEAETSDLAARADEVERQNRDLQRLIEEQEAYLSDVERLISQMESRRREWRERYGEVTGRPLADPVSPANTR
jgi:hypothetical protein